MAIDFGPPCLLQSSLTAFFDDDNIRTILIPMITRSSQVSLRILDWLVTNYAKKYNVVCKTRDGQLFNVHNRYKVALSVYRRQQFDPFRRSRRIAFESDGAQHDTTLGQCHFLYWAHTNGVFAFAEQHLSAIECDMNEVAARQRKKKRDCQRSGISKEKRKPLSDGAAFKCHVYSLKHTVTFEL